MRQTRSRQTRYVGSKWECRRRAPLLSFPRTKSGDEPLRGISGWSTATDTAWSRANEKKTVSSDYGKSVFAESEIALDRGQRGACVIGWIAPRWMRLLLRSSPLFVGRCVLSDFQDVRLGAARRGGKQRTNGNDYRGRNLSKQK